jgi:NADH dehydrogenase FAD-containing subunit
MVPLLDSSREDLRRRIVIAGANFAGLTAAQHLSSEHAVTVIDRSPWFEWLPNIHELLSGLKQPAILRLSRPRLVARAGHRFVRASVAAVDAAAAKVITSDGRDFGFDICVVAVGGVNDTLGVPGAERYAMPFKSVDQCHAIGRTLARLARRAGPLSIVIVGGGLEGVEALGEVLRRYRRRKPTIHVIEAASHLLPGAPPALDAAVRTRCAPYNVRFHMGAMVTRVTRSRVYLSSNETIRSDLTIWTGGVTAPALLQASGLADAPRCWAPVTKTLRSQKLSNVFVIGDAAALSRPMAKQAYFAMQMGACAADNVERALSGRTLRPFTAVAKPVLISLGDLDTFLVAGDRVIASPALAALKEAVFQVTMAQIDPPIGRCALRGCQARLTTAIGKLALPTLSSFEAVARLCHFGLLSRS